MKKSLNFFIFISFLTVLLTGTTIISGAEVVGSTFEQDNILKFTDLGLEDGKLFAPYDSIRLRFSLPAEYVLAPGSELRLDFTSFLSGPDADFFRVVARYTHKGKFRTRRRRRESGCCSRRRGCCASENRGPGQRR